MREREAQIQNPGRNPDSPMLPSRLWTATDDTDETEQRLDVWCASLYVVAVVESASRLSARLPGGVIVAAPR